MTCYSIGYGGRNPQELIDLLKENNIKIIVDVRLRPDRAHLGIYKKAKDNNKGIEGLLMKNGISYFSFVELGNVFMNQDDWQKKYRQLLKLSGDLLINRLRQISFSFCLLCAEKKSTECHRNILSEYLELSGYNFIHIE